MLGEVHAHADALRWVCARESRAGRGGPWRQAEHSQLTALWPVDSRDSPEQTRGRWVGLYFMTITLPLFERRL